MTAYLCFLPACQDFYIKNHRSTWNEDIWNHAQISLEIWLTDDEKLSKRVISLDLCEPVLHKCHNPAALAAVGPFLCCVISYHFFVILCYRHQRIYSVLMASRQWWILMQSAPFPLAKLLSKLWRTQAVGSLSTSAPLCIMEQLGGRLLFFPLLFCMYNIHYPIKGWDSFRTSGVRHGVYYMLYLRLHLLYKKFTREKLAIIAGLLHYLKVITSYLTYIIDSLRVPCTQSHARAVHWIN